MYQHDRLKNAKKLWYLFLVFLVKISELPAGCSCSQCAASLSKPPEGTPIIAYCIWKLSRCTYHYLLFFPPIAGGVHNVPEDECCYDDAQDAFCNMKIIRAVGSEPNFTLRVEMLYSKATHAQPPHDLWSSVIALIGAEGSGIAFFSVAHRATSTFTNCTTLVAVATPIVV